MKRIIVILLFCIILSTDINAFCFNLTKNSHSIFFGPEIYYIHRKKEGGSRQTGWLYGGNVIYERRISNGFYWALDSYITHGQITGKTRSKKRLKSNLTDTQIDGRLGYSICFQKCKNLILIPYCGYGYLHSKNDFKDPSPIPCEFHNHIQYGLVGVTNSLSLTQRLTAGLQCTAKYVFNGENKIKDDPQYDNITLTIGDEVQYEIEAPFRYTTCWRGREIIANFSPFYRLRHFGGNANYPFDFIDTKFHLYGGTFTVRLCF